MSEKAEDWIPLTAESGAKKDEAKQAELEDPERLARTVFVGNVPAATTRKELKRMFKPFGAVEAVRLRGVVAANPKLPKKTALLARRMHKDCDTMLAYVVFKPRQAKEERGEGAASFEIDRRKSIEAAAEEVNEEEVLPVKSAEGAGAGECGSGMQDLNKTRVDVNDYSNPTEAVVASCAALNLTILHEKHLRVNPALHTRGPLRKSVFLGNLPFDVTEEELIVTFKEIATEAGCNLTGVRVTRDKETGMGRGVGFVSFDDDLGVRAAMNRDGKLEVRGRVVRMERAAKEKKRNSKTFKRNAKAEKRREEKLRKGGGRSSASADKRKREERSGERITRKIRKEKSDKKVVKKVKHAARKARQAEAAAAADGVGGPR